MLSLSLSFSLLVGSWEDIHAVDKQADNRGVSTRRRQQQKREGKHKAPRGKSTHKETTTSQLQPSTPVSASPGFVDAGFTALSEQAQQLQHHARARLDPQKQRERIADSESLRVLEAATAAEAAAKLRAWSRKHHERLRIQLDAKDHDRRLRHLRLGSAWSIISTPGLKVLSKTQSLSGTPPSRASGTTASTPQSLATKSPELLPSPCDAIQRKQEKATTTSTPQASFTKPPRLSQPTRSSHDVPPPQQEDGGAPNTTQPPLSKLANSAKSLSDGFQLKQEHAGEYEAVHKQIKIEYDYVTDPFGSQLVEGGTEREARLHKSLVEYRKRQTDSVHKLFGQLEQKDSEGSRCETAENTAASGGSALGKTGGPLLVLGPDCSPQSSSSLLVSDGMAQLLASSDLQGIEESKHDRLRRSDDVYLASQEGYEPQSDKDEDKHRTRSLPKVAPEDVENDWLLI
ncbi:hypothetical protein LTR08_002998 [Meristemomyces frigidus]|nr:hypothetical protein LTR08_002998 [Meristemomyces frigidus]